MNHLVAIDFETTGLSPNKGDRIVEIGAVKFTLEGEILGTFSELANPGIDIPLEASRIYGIQNSNVIECRTTDQNWADFREAPAVTGVDTLPQ